MPYVISSLRAGTAPSERITMGAIGLGGQGMHNLKSFLTFDDVRVLAVCDVDASHLRDGQEDGGRRVRQQGLCHVQRFSRGPRPPRSRHGADRHAGPLARDPRHRSGQGGQGHLLRKADLADDRGRPGRGRYDEAVRHGLPERHAAAEHRLFSVRGGHRPQRHARQAPDPALLLSQRPDVPAAAGAAGPRGVRLRHVARPRAVRAVHAPAMSRQLPLDLRLLRRATDRPRGALRRPGPVGPRQRRHQSRRSTRAGPSSPRTACSTRPCGSRSPPRTPTA